MEGSHKDYKREREREREREEYSNPNRKEVSSVLILPMEEIQCTTIPLKFNVICFLISRPTSPYEGDRYFCGGTSWYITNAFMLQDIEVHPR